MPNTNKLTLLRKLLKALGLKDQAVDEIVDRILELLSGDDADQESVEATYPYHLRDDFLTPAEHSFYRVLRRAVEDWATICPKVSLNDVFYAQSSDYGEYRTYTNKIDRKHIDFLLCDPQTMAPMGGVELDDKSHERQDRQERDAFVQEVFKAAGLPLVRIKVRREYPVGQLRAGLRSRLGLADATSPTTDAAMSPATVSDAPAPHAIPNCPKCGIPMVLRTAKRGANAGEQFWGCANYPRCRQMLSVE